jgi:peptidyl-prolyl cis-trans isomerase C
MARICPMAAGGRVRKRWTHMMHLCRSVAGSVLWLALVVLLAGPAAEAQDKVVAKVNGKTITDTDMRLAEAEIGNDLGSLPDATRRRVLLEFLIENQLFADAAEGEQLGSGAAFNERLQYWRRRALRDAYFDKSVRATISDADAQKFYAGQVGTMKPEEEVRARHILVDSKDKAREIYEKIAHGSDFAQLAKEYSKDPGSKDQGGELGFFARGQMVPPFEEAAFRLKKGEVSEPFESQFGWHIVRVDDRRQRALPPFEVVKDRVVAHMIHRKAQEIAVGLRGKAQIEYIDPEIRSAMEKERAGGRAKQ